MMGGGRGLALVVVMMVCFAVTRMHTSLMIAEAAAAEVRLPVDVFTDSQNGTCVPSIATGKCNLRAAVQFCQYNLSAAGTATTCVAQLWYGTHTLRYGSIALGGGSSAVAAAAVRIDGNGSTVQPEGALGNNLDTRFLDVDGLVGNRSSSLHFELHDVIISGFSLSRGNGGAVRLRNVVNARIQNVTFEKNTATTGHGGAIALSSNCSGLQLVANLFSGNSALGSGGALFFDGSETGNTFNTLSQCRFTNNSAGDMGGGMHMGQGNSDNTIFQCVFERNDATSNGGGCALNFENNRNTFQSCTWDSNKAGDDGGGMYVYEANQLLTLANSTWQDNIAGNDGGFGNGGALVLWTDNDNATIRHATFQRNLARSSGGGVYLYEDNLRVQYFSCVWELNAAQDSDGGGLYAYSDNNHMQFENCVWRGSHAGGEGVAMRFRYAHVDVAFYDSTWSSNIGTSDGSGVYATGEQFFFENCSWDGAVGEYGTGVHTSCTRGSQAISPVGWIFQGCSFTDNLGLAGAVWWDQAVNVQIVDTRFAENFGLLAGGAIYNGLYSTQVTIEGCYMVDNHSPIAGGVLFSVGSSSGLVVRQTTFAGNVASSAGAVDLGLGDEATFEGCIWANNTSKNRGAAFLSVKADSITLRDCIFRNNSAGEGGAAAISNTRSSLVIDGCDFDANRARTHGGALVLSGERFAIFHNTTLQRNTALLNGGGALVKGSSRVELGNASTAARGAAEAVRFAHNTAGASGGALRIEGQAHVVDVGAELLANVAVIDGGGVSIDSGILVSINGNFTECRTTLGSGGAVYAAASSQLALYNSTMFGNSAEADGGAVFLERDIDAADVRGTSFTANEAGKAGGAVYSNTLAPRIANSTFSANKAPGGGGGGVFWDLQSKYEYDDDSVLAAGLFGYQDINKSLEFVTFHDNRAMYGANLATPPVRLLSPTSAMAKSGEELAPTRFHIKDWFNQTVSSFPTSFLEAQTNVSDAACGLNVSVADVLSAAVREAFFEGIVTFDSLVITCKPGMTVVVEFSLTNSDTSEYADILRASVPVYIDPCVYGQYLDRDTKTCQDCDNGGYAWDPSWSECKTCPQHTTCKKGWKMIVDNGYWRMPSTAFVRSCPAEDACEGGSDTSTQCATGSGGPVCQVCDQGYFQSSSLAQCQRCEDMARFVPILIVAAVALLGVAAWVWVRSFRNGKDDVIHALTCETTRVYSQIVLVFGQIVCQFQYLYSVRYPASFASASTSLGLSNLGVGLLLSPQCLNNSYSFFDTLLGQTLIPIALVTVLLLGYTLPSLMRASSATKRRRVRLTTRAWIFVIAFTVFAGSSTVAFQTFSCDSNFHGGRSYLRADYGISCRSVEYAWYRAYAACMVLVYPVAITAMIARQLYRIRDRVCPAVPTDQSLAGRHEQQLLQLLLDDRYATAGARSADQMVRSIHSELRHAVRAQDVRASKFSFLYEAYKPEFWYFEVVECLRRILMSALVVFMWPGTVTQIVASCCICMLFLVVYNWLQPYRLPLANTLALGLLTCTFALLFMTLLLFDGNIDSDAPVVGLIFVSIMLVAPTCVIIAVVYATPAASWKNHTLVKDGMDDEGEESAEARESAIMMTKMNPVRQTSGCDSNGGQQQHYPSDATPVPDAPPTNQLHQEHHRVSRNSSFNLHDM